MPLNPTWSDIAWRLALTILAGVVIGVDRGEHGRPAGLRTTLLVCLAASISMIEVNVLMPTTGKTPDSFVVFDLMRLPFGILSGMGFIGAGAIIRRDNLVLGVTTAATLWFVTVIGLCLGGGQIALGLVATTLAVIILTVLKWIERRMPAEHQGTLAVDVNSDGPGEKEICAILSAAGYRTGNWAITYRDGRPNRHIECQVRWRSNDLRQTLPPALAQLAKHRNVQEVSWKP